MYQPRDKRLAGSVKLPRRYTEFIFPIRQRASNSKNGFKNNDKDHCQMNRSEPKIPDKTPS